MWEIIQIDLSHIEELYLKSFANRYFSELYTLRGLVRTLIPFEHKDKVSTNDNAEG